MAWSRRKLRRKPQETAENRRKQFRPLSPIESFPLSVAQNPLATPLQVPQNPLKKLTHGPGPPSKSVLPEAPQSPLTVRDLWGPSVASSFWLAPVSWWTFRYFLFFLLGGGEGESEAPGKGGGSDNLLKIPSLRGGVSQEEGAEGPGGCLQRIWGGGVKYIFSGPEFPPRFFVS